MNSIAIEDKRAKEQPPEARLPPDIPPAIKKEELPKAELPPEVDKEFFVQKIVFEGNRAVSNSEIENLARQYENKAVTLRKLIGLAEEITWLYQSKGLVTSQAYVPPQRIEANTVRIRIVEGKVGAVQVQGNRYFKDSVFDRRLLSYKGLTLDYTRLMKELLYLNQNPDRKVTAVISSGKGPAESDILVTVKDRLPLHAQYEINNFGTVYTGQRRHVLSLRHNNLTGFDDTFLFKYQTSEQGAMSSYLLDYDVPVACMPEKRTRLNLLVSYSEIDLLKEFQEADVEGGSITGSFSLSQELFNTIKRRLLYTVGFEAARLIVEERDSRIYTDELRSLKAGFLFDEYDSFGKMNITNQIKLGIPDFLGASAIDYPSSSRAGAGARFFKYNLDVTRLNKFIPPSTLLVGLDVQVAANKLVDAEQMILGGGYTVRGYPEGYASGDYGFLSTAELRTPIPLVPKHFSVFGKSLSDICQLAIFADSGAVYFKDEPNSQAERRLTGAGCGLRLNVGDYTYGRIDFAWPVEGVSTENDTGQRIHFSFTAGF